MTHLLNAINNENKILNNKTFNLKAEKLVREASDNFIYFRDYEMALRQLNQVLEIDSEHVKALILKGNILFCQDKDQDALEHFEKALGINPFSAEAYGAKANTLDVLGKVKEALDCCQKALEIVSTKDRELISSLYDQKLALLIKLRRYNDAKLTLKKCYQQLTEEDSSYLASCYRDVIDKLNKEKNRKIKIAFERLKIV